MVEAANSTSTLCSVPSFRAAVPADDMEPKPLITMGHGGGGRLMHSLLEQSILPLYKNTAHARADAAVVTDPAQRLAFTTDSYVVFPIFFPGGDIGKLAVCGTINDLAMVGAQPRWLSVSLIIGEGFPESDLDKLLHSMSETAKCAGVEIVTGDTKVVESAAEPQLFINTSGVGVIQHDLCIHPESSRAGDVVIVNGDIGRHGVAVLSSRDGTAEDIGVDSDCALLHDSVLALLAAGINVHCLRDLTRGGLATALIEIAQTSGLHLELDEASIPILPAVSAYSEITGLDPLYFANEGRFIAILPDHQWEAAQTALGPSARKIGRLLADTPYTPGGRVVLRTPWGSSRSLTMLSGEQLPRIC